MRARGTPYGTTCGAFHVGKKKTGKPMIYYTGFETYPGPEAGTSKGLPVFTGGNQSI